MTERRRRQEGYYWAVVVPTLARELFTDVDHTAAHRDLATRLLPDGDDPTKRWQYRTTSVSGMSDEDFQDYLFRAVIWAALEGIELTPPRERHDWTSV